MKALTPATLTVILLLIVGGLVVAYVAKNMLAQEEPPPPERRLYPMAVSDLEPGTVITDAHLAQGPYYGKASPTFARSKTILVGRIVREKISAATPIDTTLLYPPGELPPIDLAVGMRAVSLTVGAGADVVDGLVQPGAYVDVHFTPSGDSVPAMRGGMTMTLVKGVKVLSINRTRGSRIDRANTVTLELTPEQANIVLLANAKGALTLVYTAAGPGDGGIAVADADRAYLEEILGLAPPEEPEEPIQIEHFSGPRRSIIRFRQDGTPWVRDDSGPGIDVRDLAPNEMNDRSGSDAPGDGANGAPTAPGRPLRGAPDLRGPTAAHGRPVRSASL